MFIKDFVFKKPDIQILPFPTYFEAEDDDNSEPLVADLGELDPFMVADYLIVAEAGFLLSSLKPVWECISSYILKCFSIWNILK